MKIKSTFFNQLFLIVAILFTFSLSAWGENQYSYTFTSKQFSANGTKTLNGVDWTLNGNNGNYWGYDGTKGQQFGSGSAPYKSMTLSTSGIDGKVTEIVINTSGAKDINGSFTVSVGGTQYGSSTKLTKTATSYTFTGSSSGNIVFSYTQTSSKAIYIKSISITYEPNAGETPEPDPEIPTLEKPTILVASKTFTSPFDVELSCSTDGAKIYYSFSENGEYILYENAINITETVTLYAKSKLGEIESDVVSATYTKLNISSNPTIADFLSADVNENIWYTLTGVVTIIANDTYGNLTIEDETGSVYIYGITETKVNSNDKSFSSLNIDTNDTLTISTVRGEHNGNPQGGGSNTPAYYISNKKYKAPTYTITFYNGNNKKLTEITTSEIDLSEYILPLNQACQEEGWEFAGWSTEPNITEDTENPNVLTGVYQPNVNISLYPVYKKEETTSSPESWNKTNIAEIKPTDEVVITMSNATSTYALNTANGSSNAPEAVSIKVSNEKLSNDPLENQIWNIVTDNGSYVIYPNGTTEKWLYCTNTNNGVRVGTNTNKTFTIDAASGYLKNTETVRYIGVYNSQDWRCYTNTTGNIANQTLAFYVKTGGTQVTTTYSSTLDCIEEIEMEVGYNDTLYHNQNNILYNTLTIQSKGDQAGQINVTNGSISANKVILEKTIDDSRWFFFSLPFDCKVANIEAKNATGTKLQYADSLTGDYVINYYDQTRNATTNKAWVELIDTSYTLKANQGYIIGHFGTGDVTVKFPSKDAVTISVPATKTLNYTDSWTAGDVENSTNGWNLIGLPYYQSVDGSLIPTMVSIPREDGTYNQIDYTIANIQPFTSFFVQTTEAPTFTIAAQQNAAPMLRAKGEASKAVISLVDANGVDDKTTIINNPNNTNDYEIGHDLAKWIGYAARPQIYSIQGDDILAFNSLAIDNSTIIPLGVYAHADGEYTFALNEKSMGDLQGWELYDNETGKTTRLANEALTLYLEQGTHEGRFEIRLQQRITTDCDNAMGDMTTWTANGTLNINNLPADAVVYIYDAVGRMIYAANNNSTAFNYTFTARGVYNIVVRSTDNTVSFKTNY